MQFKQLFLALCALTLIFSACKKDETPVLPDVTGSWKVVTFITTDCSDPTENSTVSAAEVDCTINNNYHCTEYDFSFKADETFEIEATVYVAGQSIGEPATGTYTVLSENEIEICYNNQCVIGSLNDNQLTFIGPDDESDCSLGFTMERN